MRRHTAYRWYNSRAVPRWGADGTVEEWVGACTDIHERRLAEIQLRESEERARLALEIGQLGTLTWVPDDDAVLADRALPGDLRPAARRTHHLRRSAGAHSP